MKWKNAALVLLFGLAIAGAGEVSASGPSDTVEPVPAVFSILTVGEEPGESDIYASGDTVFFTLYFVDTECETYFYDYRREKQSLIVTRRPVDSLSCSKDGGQAMYGVSGSIIGVPPGQYWFDFRSLCSGRSSELLKEAVQTGPVRR